MSKELLHLVLLVDQGIEVSQSQIKHCQNMNTIIKEKILPEMDPEHILAAGAIVGWGLGASGVYIENNMKKLISILSVLDIDFTKLEELSEFLAEGPNEDLEGFVEEYIDKANDQSKALEKIKKYLLSDDFDNNQLKNIYSEKGSSLIEEAFDENLRRLLEEEVD